MPCTEVGRGVVKLPNLGDAEIPDSKLRDYVLSLSHPHGRHKAAFFRGFGFSSDFLEIFRLALLGHAENHDVTAIEESPFGKRYTIQGSLNAPDGRSPLVRAVWFIEDGSATPRLVTVFPLGRRHG
ncbi:MAG: hypothetical protein V3U95_04445 [Dehalococcoidia bacterium]